MPGKVIFKIHQLSHKWLVIEATHNVTIHWLFFSPSISHQNWLRGSNTRLELDRRSCSRMLNCNCATHHAKPVTFRYNCLWSQITSERVATGIRIPLNLRGKYAVRVSFHFQENCLSRLVFFTDIHDLKTLVISLHAVALFIHFSFSSSLRETRVITSWPPDVEATRSSFLVRFVFLWKTRSPIWKTGPSSLQCSGSMISIVNPLTLSCLYRSMDCTTSQIMRTFCRMMQSGGTRSGRLTKGGTFDYCTVCDACSFRPSFPSVSNSCFWWIVLLPEWEKGFLASEKRGRKSLIVEARKYLWFAAPEKSPLPENERRWNR